MTDIGVKADSDPNDTELMFHRIGLRVGAMITEKEFERGFLQSECVLAKDAPTLGASFVEHSD